MLGTQHITPKVMNNQELVRKPLQDIGNLSSKSDLEPKRKVKIPVLKKSVKQDTTPSYNPKENDNVPLSLPEQSTPSKKQTPSKARASPTPLKAMSTPTPTDWAIYSFEEDFGGGCVLSGGFDDHAISIESTKATNFSMLANSATKSKQNSNNEFDSNKNQDAKMENIIQTMTKSTLTTTERCVGGEDNTGMDENYLINMEEVVAQPKGNRNRRRASTRGCNQKTANKPEEALNNSPIGLDTNIELPKEEPINDDDDFVKLRDINTKRGRRKSVKQLKPLPLVEVGTSQADAAAAAKVLHPIPMEQEPEPSTVVIAIAMEASPIGGYLLCGGDESGQHFGNAVTPTKYDWISYEPPFDSNLVIESKQQPAAFVSSDEAVECDFQLDAWLAVDDSPPADKRGTRAERGAQRGAGASNRRASTRRASIQCKETMKTILTGNTGTRSSSRRQTRDQSTVQVSPEASSSTPSIAPVAPASSSEELIGEFIDVASPELFISRRKSTRRASIQCKAELKTLLDKEPPQLTRAAATPAAAPVIAPAIATTNSTETSQSATTLKGTVRGRKPKASVKNAVVTPSVEAEPVPDLSVNTPIVLDEPKGFTEHLISRASWDGGLMSGGCDDDLESATQSTVWVCLPVVDQAALLSAPVADAPACAPSMGMDDDMDAYLYGDAFAATPRMTRSRRRASLSSSQLPDRDIQQQEPSLSEAAASTTASTAAPTTVSTTPIKRSSRKSSNKKLETPSACAITPVAEGKSKKGPASKSAASKRKTAAAAAAAAAACAPLPKPSQHNNVITNYYLPSEREVEASGLLNDGVGNHQNPKELLNYVLSTSVDCSSSSKSQLSQVTAAIVQQLVEEDGVEPEADHYQATLDVCGTMLAILFQSLEKRTHSTVLSEVACLARLIASKSIQYIVPMTSTRKVRFDVVCGAAISPAKDSAPHSWLGVSEASQRLDRIAACMRTLFDRLEALTSGSGVSLGRSVLLVMEYISSAVGSTEYCSLAYGSPDASVSSKTKSDVKEIASLVTMALKEEVSSRERNQSIAMSKRNFPSIEERSCWMKWSTIRAILRWWLDEPLCALNSRIPLLPSPHMNHSSGMLSSSDDVMTSPSSSNGQSGVFYQLDINYDMIPSELKKGALFESADMLHTQILYSSKGGNSESSGISAYFRAKKTKSMSLSCLFAQALRQYAAIVKGNFPHTGKRHSCEEVCSFAKEARDAFHTNLAAEVGSFEKATQLTVYYGCEMARRFLCDLLAIPIVFESIEGQFVANSKTDGDESPISYWEMITCLVSQLPSAEKEKYLWLLEFTLEELSTILSIPIVDRPARQKSHLLSYYDRCLSLFTGTKRSSSFCANKTESDNFGELEDEEMHISDIEELSSSELMNIVQLMNKLIFLFPEVHGNK